MDKKITILKMQIENPYSDLTIEDIPIDGNIEFPPTKNMIMIIFLLQSYEHFFN